MYRLPEVASERHQALEERWARGIWLGHARHSPEILIGTPKGVVKSYAVRRLPEGQQWDGEMLRSIVGSPTNWRLDMGEDSQLVETEDRDDPELNPELASRRGQRTGERKAMYLSRRDFETHALSDGRVPAPHPPYSLVRGAENARGDEVHACVFSWG